MNDYENAVEVRNITKRFDGFTLDSISFNAAKGAVTGFIGQNGAGKTTTLKAILNIIRPDEGSIGIFGMDSVKDEAAVKERLSAVFDIPPYHDELTANDLDIIFADIYKNWDKGVFADHLDRFSLPRKKKIGKLSRGMKMKLQLACALSHGAELLIMDEPTGGLDPVVRGEILDIFREFICDESHSILISSHITSDLERIADNVTFINKGKLLLSGNKDDILDNHTLVKCGLGDYKDIKVDDFISARLTDFGAELMVSDKRAFTKKYSGLTADVTTLDEIMIFYVNADKKEWR